MLAANSPSDCFDCAIEASRIAPTYMTPVILLSDLYVANGAEPWKIPNVSELPEIKIKFADPNQELVVYKRDPQTLQELRQYQGKQVWSTELEDWKNLKMEELVMIQKIMKR